MGGLRPASLAGAPGGPPDRLAVLAAVLEEIDKAYERLWRGEADALRADWSRRLAGRDTCVRVETDGGAIDGVFADVAPDGALLLDTPGGQRRILAGDVVLGPRAVGASQ